MQFIFLFNAEFNEVSNETGLISLDFDHSRCASISQLGHRVLSSSCLPDANIAFILFIECKHRVFGQFCCLNLALSKWMIVKLSRKEILARYKFDPVILTKPFCLGIYLHFILYLKIVFESAIFYIYEYYLFFIHNIKVHHTDIALNV